MPQPWKVHKFGGTSVLNADRYKGVGQIITDLMPKGPKAVVVSAMKGVTDDLIRVVELAKSNDDSFKTLLVAVSDRHGREISSLLSSGKAASLLKIIEKDMAELAEILRGVWLTRTAGERTVELISGMGEVWSAQILNAYWQDQGHKTEWLDARKILVIEHGHRGVKVHWDKSKEKFATWFKQNTFDLVTITGYVAAMADGTATTLGRNGSDFSASIFGSLFGSDEIFIWTDVDGVLSGDPKQVPEAVILDEMSYSEMAELAYFGAKVVHPATMAPAMANNCTIWIRNTFNPSHPGTKIHRQAKSNRRVKGLSAINHICLVNVEGTGMIGLPGVAERLFGALRSRDVNVVLISQASSEQSICLAIEERQAEIAKRAIEEAFCLEIEQGQIQTVTLTKDVHVLAAVGDNMAQSPGVAAQLFTALGQSGVNVRAIAQGSSERNISVVIDAKDSIRALRTVHSAFIMPHQRISLGVVGVGLIGGTFLKQLNQQLDHLRSNKEIDIQVRGISDSKRMLLADGSIPLASWQTELKDKGQNLNLAVFANHIQSSHIPHAVLVEATASESLTVHYQQWLRQGLHIISPNKKANSSSMEFYRQIKDTARQAGRHFLYSTNVGAGLPLIQTLRDLAATGDRVHSIQGLMSGTLAYIFSQYDGSKPFSQVLLAAKEQGYTEPDPRDDLSGQDVVRKVVILAREAGMALESADVMNEGLIPNSLKSVPLPEFLARMVEMDQPMLALLNQAKAKDQVLRFVGSVEIGGQARVALQSLPVSHVLARANGSDNIVLFQTDRYFQQPLIIQGPGAGPEVTAGGVFADLLRLSRYLGAIS